MATAEARVAASDAATTTATREVRTLRSYFARMRLRCGSLYDVFLHLQKNINT